MARKSITVTITAPGRDLGKSYLVTEMSASQAERWAARALLALAKSGVDIPADIASAGLAGMALLGIRALAGASYYDVEPLLQEMMDCIQYIPDLSQPAIPNRRLIEDDIEEVATRLHLRGSVMELMTGFSIAAAMSKSTAALPISTDPIS